MAVLPVVLVAPEAAEPEEQPRHPMELPVAQILVAEVAGLMPLAALPALAVPAS